LVYFSGLKYILARQILHFSPQNARQSDNNDGYCHLSWAFLTDNLDGAPVNGRAYFLGKVLCFQPKRFGKLM